MKKILVISYYWPPSGGSGVQRWLYFCKYLSEFGYEPIVLTVAEKKASYKNTDTNFVEKVAAIKTYKTNTFEPLKIYSWLTTGSSLKGIPHGNIQKHQKSFLQKIAAFVRGNFFIPDARIGWKKFALKKARQIIQSEKIDLIITTGPPHSAHLIGMQLKKEFNIKWLADFRDPWLEIYYNKELPRLSWAIKKDERLEKKVLENADNILTVGFKLKQLLQQKTPLLRNKFHHIYNGFDAELMNEIIVKKKDHFEVTFVGLLTQKQSYQTILKALQLFVAEHPKATIKLCLAGIIDDQIITEFKNSLAIPIDVKGYVSHKEALTLMKQAQLLWNSLPEMEESQILISGKQMEYIATGNPIITIGNSESECALLMETIQNTMMLEKEQHREAANFISLIYEQWNKNELYLNNTDIESIKSKSRYETARQLAAYLDTIVP